MSVNSFIPEIWDANVLIQLDKTLILGDPAVVNNDYEGDIADAGDTVHITRLVDPTIRDYVPNETVINPDSLSTDEQVFTIDQCKYYAIEIDDVDRRQVKGELLTKAAQRAAYRMRVLADTYIGTRMIEGAGTILDPVTISKSTPDNLYGLFLEMQTEFDELNVPTDSRWIAASPDVVNMLAWDQRFTSANHYGNNALIMNGEMGNILGFAIKKSTNMPVGAGGASKYLIGGQGNSGMTFAQQVNKTEAYRPQNSFGDAIKGLHLYGGKVIQPEYLMAVDVTVS